MIKSVTKEKFLTLEEINNFVKLFQSYPITPTYLSIYHKFIIYYSDIR